MKLYSIFNFTLKRWGKIFESGESLINRLRR